MVFDWNIKSRKFKILLGIFISLVIIAGIVMFYGVKTCEGYECFRENMNRCKSNVVYINEEPEASWRYTILGKENNECDIKVELVLAKEGSLGINKLQNQEMVCSYPIGTVVYPEKDLEKCHGILKENLQKMIIDKLQAYIIENLGSYDAALNK